MNKTCCTFSEERKSKEADGAFTKSTDWYSDSNEADVCKNWNSKLERMNELKTFINSKKYAD